MLDFGFYNMDCLEGMKEFPDGYFDLAIVDPPYGGAGNEFKRSDKSRFGGRFDIYRGDIKIERRGCGWNNYGDKIIKWDEAPSEEYFTELFRVAKKVIIWGGITSTCRRAAVSLSGRKPIFPKSSLCRCANTRGQTLMTTRRSFADHP